MVSTTTPPLDGLLGRLGRTFSDPELLERAVSHRSWCAEQGGLPSNERLEFLGDAVLGLVVTDYIFRRNPDLPEGELAKIRSAVVSTAALAEVAAELGLGEALRLGRGEDASGGRGKPSILADAMEAVIGATYLDGGWTAADTLVLGLLEARIDDAVSGPGGHDFKTRLQEVAAHTYEALPVYLTTDAGPDHAKEFHTEVRLAGRLLGEGAGRSKKQAEQAAARVAWDALHTERPFDDDQQEEVR